MLAVVLLLFFRPKARRNATRQNISVDGIVLIKILFKLHAFEKTVESRENEGEEAKGNETSSHRA